MKYYKNINGFSFLILAFVFLFQTTGLGAQYVPRQFKSRGIPAYPFETKVIQSNGDEIILRAKGDRVIHWYESEDGRTVLQNEEGDFVYAELDDKGDMHPSTSLVLSKDDILFKNIEDKVGFSLKQIKSLEENYYPQSRSAKSNPNPFPSLGNNNVLVLLADFPDRQSVSTRADIASLMNDVAYNGTGSFRDYYLAISYGALDLQSTVVDWAEVSENMSYYGQNDEFGFDKSPQELVRDVVDQAEASGIDFSQFDNDNDGYCDEVVVFHAGFAEQYTGGGDTCIWSHAFHLGDLSVTYDGVIIDNYIIGSELRGTEGDTIVPIGTIVHEFAHSLAMPDLYDVDYEGSGGYAFDLNFWDLLAVGSWNNRGITPSGINAWLKEYMGWMKIPVITEAGSYTLNNAYENQEAYKIETPTHDEFFILENRQWLGFDSEIPGYGMLIYHVDLNHEGWQTGYINIDPAHQGLDIEEADNIRDSLTIDGDAFPGFDGVTAFNDTTVPSANMWNGQESYVNIHNIVQDGWVITFDYGNVRMDEVPEEWEFEPAAYSDTTYVNAMVMIVNDTAARGYLSALVGDEVRGVAPATFYPATNNYVFKLEVYSNQATGEELSFRYYDPVLDSTYLLMDSLEFVSSSISGSLQDPFCFTTPTIFSKSFIQGWNWFSVNVNQEDMSLNSILSDCVTPDDYIKSQTASSTYYAGYGWFGTLEDLTTEKLYLINVSTVCGIDYVGVAENPSVSIIDLVPGWNWLGYMPQEVMSPTEALASLNSQADDYLKSQTSSTTFYDNYGWFGTLAEMNPGEGYMLKLTAADELQYALGGGATKALLNGADYSGKGLNVDPYKYEFSGSLTASVSHYGEDIGSEGDVLYAYSGNECRGHVEAKYFAPEDALVFPIMIYSNVEEGEDISFRYYTKKRDAYFGLYESLSFRKDMVINDALNALVLTVDAEITGEEMQFDERLSLQIAPNPVRENMIIDYGIAVGGEVQIDVYDLVGRKIQELESGSLTSGNYKFNWRPEGLESGTYLLQLQSGEERIIKKFIYLK